MRGFVAWTSQHLSCTGRPQAAGDDNTRTVIATYGTTGDVQPLLALGVELRRRGHSVDFGAPLRFADRVREVGLEFLPLGPPQDPDEFRQVYGRASLVSDPVQHIRRTLELAVRDAPQMIGELARACERADALISLPFQLAGAIVHELLRVPLISVNVSPFAGYSRRFAEAASGPINALRASYGLAPVSDTLGAAGGSSLLSIFAVSPLLFRRPRHWPAHCHLTGFCFLDEPFTPDSDLAQFLDSGEPPIVITFGSMVHLAPEELAGTLLTAIRQVGRCAIVQRGWTDLRFESLPKEVRLVDFVPHSWLFPRAACVVHAGGAGTTAATLRAGVPSVVIPHLLDQFVWAALLQENGYSADTIPFHELTADRLAASIKRALLPEWGQRVSRVSEQISGENGASTAAALIESHLAETGNSLHAPPQELL